jgi:hypothetical protein
VAQACCAIILGRIAAIILGRVAAIIVGRIATVFNHSRQSAEIPTLIPCLRVPCPPNTHVWKPEDLRCWACQLRWARRSIGRPIGEPDARRRRRREASSGSGHSGNQAASLSSLAVLRLSVGRRTVAHGACPRPQRSSICLPTVALPASTDGRRAGPKRSGAGTCGAGEETRRRTARFATGSGCGAAARGWNGNADGWIPLVLLCNVLGATVGRRPSYLCTVARASGRPRWS